MHLPTALITLATAASVVFARQAPPSPEEAEEMARAIYGDNSVFIHSSTTTPLTLSPLERGCYRGYPKWTGTKLLLQPIITKKGRGKMRWIY